MKAGLDEADGHKVSAYCQQLLEENLGGSNVATNNLKCMKLSTVLKYSTGTIKT